MYNAEYYNTEYYNELRGIYTELSEKFESNKPMTREEKIWLHMASVQKRILADHKHLLEKILEYHDDIIKINRDLLKDMTELEEKYI